MIANSNDHAVHGVARRYFRFEIHPLLPHEFITTVIRHRQFHLSVIFKTVLLRQKITTSWRSHKMTSLAEARFCCAQSNKKLSYR